MGTRAAADGGGGGKETRRDNSVSGDDRLRSSVQVGEGAVLCQGWLDKEPPRSGLNSVLNLGAADWKPRYFALVVMYVDGGDHGLALDGGAQRGGGRGGGSSSPERASSKYWLRLRRNSVLVWFDTKEHFEDWYSLLREDQRSRQQRDGSTDGQCRGSDRESDFGRGSDFDGSSVLPASVDVGPSLGGVLKVLELPHVAGFLVLSKQSVKAPVSESLRLDSNHNSERYRVLAIESLSGNMTYRLGALSSEDFDTWIRALNKALLGGVPQKGYRQSRSSRKPGFPPDDQGGVRGSTSAGLSSFQGGQVRRSSVEGEMEALPNKWKQEVTFPLHHPVFVVAQLFSVGYLFALVWLLNPHLKPCAQEVFIDDQGFCQLANGNLDWDGDCVPWSVQSENLGAWRAWVSGLEGSLFDSSVHFHGRKATCFKVPTSVDLTLFWIFVLMEVISTASNFFAGLMCWSQVRRGARQLNELQPNFPKEHWPSVDVMVCHYSEASSESVDTLKACLELEYPPHLLNIVILDDGYLKADYSRVKKKKAYWPDACLNSSNMRETGDLRAEVKKFLTELESTMDHQPPTDQSSSSEPQPQPPTGVDSASGHEAASVGGKVSLLSTTTTECIPDPSNKERVVPRIDCAVGYVRDEYRLRGLPTVTYVARLKPEKHHAKAGNINNALYNMAKSREQVGRYCAIFDNDMQPHPKFLTSCLPLFFEPEDGSDDEEEGSSQRASSATLPSTHSSARAVYTDAVKSNGNGNGNSNRKLAYVQTPQYFKTNELMLAAGGDPLAHENTTFMAAGLPGMDGFDSCMFVGTNCLWRRQALDSIAGIQYGTVSEDFWTGRTAHQKGWDSAYLRKDYVGFEGEHRFRLAQGEVPPTVAAALVQRKRWHKGGVELFLGVEPTSQCVDQEWLAAQEAEELELGDTPASVKWFREMQWNFARMSWLTTLPAIFYPLMLVYALFARSLWFYLNPVPTLLFMCPRLFLSSFVIYLGAYFIDHEHLLNDETEYFSYAWIRLLGTGEAFYSKWVSGAPAAWGNTGAASGGGSPDELPNLLLVTFLAIGLVVSVLTFLFVDQVDDVASFIPVWGFTCMTLKMLWPIVRTSIQEFFGWSYKSLNMGQLSHSLLPAMLMALAVITSQRKEVYLAEEAAGNSGSNAADAE